MKPDQPRLQVIPLPRTGFQALGHEAHSRLAVGVQYEQPTLALEYPVPTARRRVAQPWLHLVGDPDEVQAADPSDPDDDGFFHRQRTDDTDLPEPRQWAARYAQAYVEIRAGRRPPHQLARWTAGELYAQLVRTARIRAGINRTVARPRITSLRICRPAVGTVEACAVVQHNHGRSRALAFRLEGWDGRWICTTIDLI